MILIIGGAFQGKLDYAISNFNLKIDDISDGESCSLEEAFGRVCLNNFHLLVSRFHNTGVDFEEQLATGNCSVIIADEICSGIIPFEKSDRELREVTGRLLCRFAALASVVIRIHCGVPVTIKGGML